MNADEQKVADALMAYQEALNRSDTEAVIRLYAPDGVFMPQNSPSSVGADAVRRAYDAVFGAITLRVRFTIAEIRQLAPEWGLARTNSAGTVENPREWHGGGRGQSGALLFQKVGDAWKIARYCFSTTNPA